MPGETEIHPSGWTTDTAMAHMQAQHDNLVELLQERATAQEVAMSTALTAQQLAVAAAMSSAKEAVTKAELANDARFRSVNEFRQTLSDQASTFITRIEHEALIDRIDRVEGRADTNDGHGKGVSAAWAVGVAALAGLIGVLGFAIAMIDLMSR
jgi:PDZ domain-containing secreted protein